MKKQKPNPDPMLKTWNIINTSPEAVKIILLLHQQTLLSTYEARRLIGFGDKSR